MDKTKLINTDEVLKKYDNVLEFVKSYNIEVIETPILKTNSKLKIWKIKNDPFPCIYLKEDLSQEAKDQYLLLELENYFKIK